jgi:hypothetical protein
MIPFAPSYPGARLRAIKALRNAKERREREAPPPDEAFNAERLRRDLASLPPDVRVNGDEREHLRKMGWTPERLTRAQVALHENLGRRVHPQSPATVTAGAGGLPDRARRCPLPGPTPTCAGWPPTCGLRGHGASTLPRCGPRSGGWLRASAQTGPRWSTRVTRDRGRGRTGGIRRPPGIGQLSGPRGGDPGESPRPPPHRGPTCPRREPPRSQKQQESAVPRGRPEPAGRPAARRGQEAAPVSHNHSRRVRARFERRMEARLTRDRGRKRRPEAPGSTTSPQQLAEEARRLREAADGR